jgi:hypothetical protein
MWSQGLPRQGILDGRKEETRTMKNEDFKKGLPGVGTDSFMENFKCRFCGTTMDERAVLYTNGEYTRELEFYCPNMGCPGPPTSYSNKMCGVCLGRPLESGRECICGGIGTETAELDGIRKAYHELQCEFDAVMQLGIDKWLSGDELKYNPATRAAMAREKALRAIEGHK